MTPLEATRRAREAVLRHATGAGGPVDVGDLVAVAEAAGGLCPRQGKALIGALLRAGRLTRAQVRRA